MGRRGGFAHSYDPAAMRALMDAAAGDTDAWVNERVLPQVRADAAEFAAELAATHGVPSDVVELWLAQRVSEATDFSRWVAAARTRGRGNPVRALLDAMGFSSPTSVSRMVPTLDYVASLYAVAEASGEPQKVVDDRGFEITITPTGDSEAVEVGRKRGWLPPEA